MQKESKSERISGGLGRCMLPLLDALGWQGGKRLFLNALPYDYSNFSVEDMMNTLATLGFRVNCSTGHLSALDSRLMPCLYINRNKNPFVLLSRENNRIFTFEGERSDFTNISVDEAGGTFYFFEPMSIADVNPEKTSKDWFILFLTRFRTPFLLSFLYSLILTFTALMSPLIVMGIYSQINSAESLSGFWLIGSGIFGILLVDLLFRVFRFKVLSFIGSRMGYLVSTQVFRRILSFSPSATENASIGSQIVRLQDFNSVRTFIEGSGITSVMELPFFIILFIGLAIMGGVLAYIPLVAALILIFFSFMISPFVKQNNTKAAASGSKKQAFLIEFFSEFREIRMSGLTKRWANSFEEISASAAIDSLKTANINSIINNVSQAVVSIAGTVTIGIGVLGVLNGDFSGAVLIAAMMLVWKILSPITSGFSVFSQFVRVKKSVGQLNRLMSMPMENDANNTSTLNFEGRIVFKGVSIRYRSDYYPALLGVEFSVDQGDFVILNGHDGAGKSTILKLIMGMYRAQAGGVTIDETNIQQLSPSLLRRSICYLPQEDRLFNGSIEKNLKDYLPTAQFSDFDRVLKLMGLKEEIEKMPAGIKTEVSELRRYTDPVSFSRRLCIARAFLNNAGILLLDEPDIGLSKEQLFILTEALEKMKNSKTIIIASNHPVFKPLADKIITMNMGTISNIEKQ